MQDIVLKKTVDHDVSNVLKFSEQVFHVKNVSLLKMKLCPICDTRVPFDISFLVNAYSWNI